ncbi:hypothetical protein NHF45_01485 [Maricaulaceae bacterium NA33B04]|nr:hypothetical protein [Maricaulaceae bacterium NA33B04]
MFRALVLVLISGAVATGLAHAAFTGFALVGEDDHVTAHVPSDYHFDGALVIDPDTTHVNARWTISIDQPDTDTLTYWLNANLTDVEVTGDTVASVSVAPSPASPQMTAVTIELSPEAERPHQFEISYAGVLFPEPMANRINSISPDKVEFTVDSFWQPFDARFDQAVTGHISIDIPGDWTPVSPGEARQREGGVDIVFSAPTMDFPITLLTEFTLHQTERYQVFDTRPGERDLTAITEMVGFCARYLDARYGEREPLPRANVVIHTRPSSGYARGTLIALTDIGEEVTPSIQRFICHELAHYWASNGNAMTVENWLNEAFAEYIAIMAVRAQLGDDAYAAQIARLEQRLADLGPQPPIWTPDDLSRRPYGVNYVKGPLALADLETRIGEADFAEFARLMMVDRLSTTPELLATLEAVAGPDHRNWFEVRLAE